MSTNTHHFTIHSPSPSTISYTTSSLSSPRSKPSIFFRHICRIVVTFYAILTIVLKAQDSFEEFDRFKEQIDFLTQYSLVGNFLARISQSLNWWGLCFTTLITLYLCLKRDYVGMFLRRAVRLMVGTRSSC